MPKPRSFFDLDEVLKSAHPPPRGRRCDVPECACLGEYRAPKSRAQLREYFWFCLDHVRAYNASWDYYAGMSTAQIEAHLKADTIWQRPTWPLGGRQAANREGQRTYRFRDDFGLFDDLYDQPNNQEATRRQRAATPQGQALALFDLSPPVTLVEVKARYKELVKLHHPDTNGGDKAAEERLKLINEAYVILRAWLVPS
jgi:hypothetical protein